MSKLSRPIYILMVIFLCCITTNLHSQDVVLLGGDLIIINSKCETFTLNKLLRFNKNTFAIVFKGASCSECIEKAYEFAHKARLLNPNMNIMVLSNYSSCRVQRILEVKYDLK